MDAVKNDVKRLVKIELAAANKKFRMFARKEQLAADPAKVEAQLVARCPAKERRGHSHTPHAPVLADDDAVAVQPHSHTTVGITGMDKVSRYIEVFLH